MMSYKHIWQLVACLVTLEVACAYPQERHSSVEPSQRLSAVTDVVYLNTDQKLEHLYKMERTLVRLRRAVDDLSNEYENADDMELAEINVFRPLFRYRGEVARRVKNPQQFG
ncbi:uncharacterized protein [Drosophila virilis]|uniref:Uncharacterized protein n=1 Tax=Drosophila virilis TaxID=7244 RepID=B4LJ72_DROVI|nr:uncharacterized protein LOC6625682 [Drosophila virilis]EDW61508.1 uncharacterized protein Dvir_GJ20279 [Drosophila virilis]